MSEHQYLGGTTAMTAAVNVDSRKVGAVDAYLAEIDRLDKATAQLVDRLVSVLRPWEEDPGPGPDQPQAVRAPVHDINERLCRAVDRLIRLVERIEL